MGANFTPVDGVDTMKQELTVPRFVPIPITSAQPDRMTARRAAYVLRRKGRGDTPVFQDGGTGGRDAVAVFSLPESADLYLQVARWDGYEVADLSPPDLADFLKAAQGQGVAHALVNPNRLQQERGVEQPMLHLERTDGQSGERLYDEVMAVGGNGPASTHA